MQIFSMFALLSTIYNHWILTKSTILLLVGHCLECWCARLAPCTLIYNLQPLDFGKIYNINYKLAKSTSTINLFTTHLKPNHQLILTEYTIYKKRGPPLLSRHFQFVKKRIDFFVSQNMLKIYQRCVCIIFLGLKFTIIRILNKSQVFFKIKDRTKAFSYIL